LKILENFEEMHLNDCTLLTQSNSFALDLFKTSFITRFEILNNLKAKTGNEDDRVRVFSAIVENLGNLLKKVFSLIEAVSQASQKNLKYYFFRFPKMKKLFNQINFSFKSYQFAKETFCEIISCFLKNYVQLISNAGAAETSEDASTLKLIGKNFYSISESI
jgi:hypothetical protein